jgi:hypothetical protein
MPSATDRKAPFTQEQFEQIHKTYNRKLFFWFRKRVNADVAEELTANTLVKLWRSDYRGDCAVTTTSSGTTAVTLPQIQVASVSTPVLSPNTQFQTAVSLTGEAWNFFSISISPMAACRVRLYGTPQGQTSDAGRNQFTGPGFGTEQDII